MTLALFRTIVGRRITDYLRGFYRRREELVEEFPDQAIEAATVRIDGDLVERLLGELEKDDRKLLEMQVVEGMTYQELSNLRGQPRGSILTRIHRIKRRLREKAIQLGEGSR